MSEKLYLNDLSSVLPPMVACVFTIVPSLNLWRQNVFGRSAHRGMSFRALKRLIFAQTKGKTIVRPSKRPIAGWLALAEDRIFEMLTGQRACGAS